MSTLSESEDLSPQRILLVGLGARGSMWSRILEGRQDCSVIAAVDPNEQVRIRYVEHHPATPVFASVSEALAASIPFDAAILVTPPDGHLDQCLELFAQHIPVLCEKPLSTSLEEAIAIVRAAQQAGVPLSVGLNFRYLPVHQEQRRWLTEARLGRPGFGEFIYRRNRDGMLPRLNKYPLTMRHPMMLEQSIHHLDLIRFCYASEPAVVRCRTSNPVWSMYAHDANVQATLTLENGVEVNYMGTWTGGWNELEFQWRTDCERGVLYQKQLFSDLYFANADDTSLTPIPLEACEPFFEDTRELFGSFLYALRHHLPVPCDGVDHLQTLAMCFAGIESSETERAVNMAEFINRFGINTL